jgi:YVTN family beta-propeller protein
VRELAMTLASTQVALDQGRAAVTASVTNSAPALRRVVLGVFAPEPRPGGVPGAQPAWATVEKPLRELAPGATEQYVVSFATPPGLAAGAYELKLVPYPADAAPEEYAAGAQVLRLVVGPTAPPPRPKKRWWLWVLAAVLLVAVGATVYLLTRPQQPPAGRDPASAVVATVPVGSYPSGIAIEPSSGVLYVTNRDSNTVSVLTPSADGPAVTDELPVGVSPIGVAAEPQGGRVYVANQGSSAISLVDIASGGAFGEVILDGSPYGVAVHPVSRHVWVTLEDGRVAVVDPSAQAVLGTVDVGPNPRELVWNSSDEAFYVASQGSDSVGVIDADSRTVTGSITVGENPAGVAVDPSDGTVYVANVLGDSVSVIEPGTQRVAETIPVGINPAALAVDPEARALYVANSDGTVFVMDTESGDVVDTIEVGSTPTAVAVDPGSGTVYVANAGDGTVSVLQAGATE